MTSQEAIEVLRKEAQLTEDGLPFDLFLFVSQLTPLDCVDLLIKDENDRTLFSWRDDDIFGRGWHLPGGVIRHNETIEERIVKVGQIELGCALEFESKPLVVEQNIDKQKIYRSHFFGFLYRCRISSPLDETLEYTSGEPKVGQWAWFEGTPSPLIKVHELYREYY